METDTLLENIDDLVSGVKDLAKTAMRIDKETKEIRDKRTTTLGGTRQDVSRLIRCMYDWNLAQGALLLSKITGLPEGDCEDIIFDGFDIPQDARWSEQDERVVPISDRKAAATGVNGGTKTGGTTDAAPAQSD